MAQKSSNNDEKKPSEFKEVADSYRSGWAYAEYAFQYGMAIVVCVLIGYGLDRWLDTGNTLMIIGVVFGSVFGFLGLLKSVGVFNPVKKQGSRKEE